MLTFSEMNDRYQFAKLMIDMHIYSVYTSTQEPFRSDTDLVIVPCHGVCRDLSVEVFRRLTEDMHLKCSVQTCDELTVSSNRCYRLLWKDGVWYA